MAGVSESHRQRIALILVGIGLVLILLGFWLLMSQAAGPEPLSITTRPASVPLETKARALRHLLFYLVMLVLVFLVSTLAFLRWSRHFRRALLRKPKRPTPSEDVWTMHKLPDGAIEDWEEE